MENCDAGWKELLLKTGICLKPLKYKMLIALMQVTGPFQGIRV
jgi:hypothetical protein